ncbi:RNA polymerase sigma factor [Gemmata obscuriglobus]|uniref:RNA polymerase sigma factor n=1 Tax=Gemmata obscuriglobus TaxID=114 RepID=UPI00016C352F|nr:sigma-70 family RNA polymerase sigma factor [Gemmata obscuriglobus]
MAVRGGGEHRAGGPPAVGPAGRAGVADGFPARPRPRRAWKRPPDQEPDFDTRAAVAELPERYRALVVACDLRGESQSAVARQLGVPVGTVYSRLSAARRLLAGRLRRRGAEPTALAVGLGAVAPEAVALPSVSECPSASVTELTEGIMSQGSALKW